MSAPKNQVVPAAPGCCLVGVDHVDQNSPYTMESYSPENRIPIVGWVVNADKVDPINKERGDGMTSSGLSYYLADPVVIESPMPRGVTYAIKMADSERLCDPELREYQNEESFFESVKNSTARDKQKLSVICVDRDRPASAVWSLNFKCRPCLREFFTNNNGVFAKWCGWAVEIASVVAGPNLWVRLRSRPTPALPPAGRCPLRS